MKPVSPVIPNADAPEKVIAEHQPEYQNLPSILLEDGIILCRWKMTDEEIEIVRKTGDVYLYQWTSGKYVTPMLLQVETPVIGGVEEIKDDVLEAETLEVDSLINIAQSTECAPRPQKARIRCSFGAIQYKPGFGLENGFADDKPYVETYKGRFFVDKDVWIVVNPMGEKDVYSSEEFHQIYSLENS